MDPVSITIGVIGTAGVTLHSARRVYELISGVKGAPSAVNDLSRDVEALRDTLESLQGMFCKNDPQKGLIQDKIMLSLQKPLDNCTATLLELETKIIPFVKKASNGKISVWRGFIWTFREKDIGHLQNNLMSHKQSLDIALSVTDL